MNQINPPQFSEHVTFTPPTSAARANIVHSNVVYNKT